MKNGSNMINTSFKNGFIFRLFISLIGVYCSLLGFLDLITFAWFPELNRIEFILVLLKFILLVSFWAILLAYVIIKDMNFIFKSYLILYSLYYGIKETIDYLPYFINLIANWSKDAFFDPVAELYYFSLWITPLIFLGLITRDLITSLKQNFKTS